MKVVIKKRAMFKTSAVSKEFWEYCKEQCYYEIQDPHAQYPRRFQNAWSVNDVHCIPPTRVKDLLAEIPNVTIVDKRAVIPAKIPKPSFELYPGQQAAFDEFLKFESDGEPTCIMHGNPGFGKTIWALYVMWHLQQKTLIVVHNLNLLGMWVKEIKKWFGITPGIIGDGKRDYAGHSIVVGNIRTLNMMANELSEEFGLVVLDEMHHCVATTFTNFLESNAARIRIGLSGTLKRKDGLQAMFKDYFGYNIIKPEKDNVLDPVIHAYTIDVPIDGNRNIPWGTRANSVYENPEFFQHIMEKAYVYYRLGHKILITSERTWLINKMEEFFQEAGIPVYSITGQVLDLDERERIMQEVAKEPKGCVLVAASSIFSEGVSLNELSCLITANIIGDNESLIEQIVARIQRKAEGKLMPVVVDTQLKGGTGERQASHRRRTYSNNGWQVIRMSDEAFDNLRKIAFAKEHDV